MNSTSLYVTTNQIILKGNPDIPSTWQDLYRLLPYLRNSLCCVVCCNLLISPLTPTTGKCQHHLCNKCKGGKKKIKPACVWCKECLSYTENKQLRTLLQCYKKMCIFLLNSNIYKNLIEASKVPATGVERGAGNLLILIKEGAMFQDHYECNVGLSKDVYSILPCVYTNSSTQTLQNCQIIEGKKNIIINPKNTNGTPVYSVMYAGTGNKITIKRKPKDHLEKQQGLKKDSNEKAVFKKPPSKCVVKQRKGCRCGNATATPGKLTCCGQRCPCYVDSKACVECKCRGCRNPHTPDGNKVINLPHVINQYKEQQSKPIQQLQAINSREIPVLQHVKIELDANLTIEQLNEHLKLQVYESYSKIPQTLPHTFLMNTKREDEDEEITVDV